MNTQGYYQTKGQGVYAPLNQAKGKVPTMLLSQSQASSYYRKRNTRMGAIAPPITDHTYKMAPVSTPSIVSQLGRGRAKKNLRKGKGKLKKNKK